MIYKPSFEVYPQSELDVVYLLFCKFVELKLPPPVAIPQPDSGGIEWKPVRWYEGMWHHPGWKEPTPEELEKFDRLWSRIWKY